MNRIMLLGRIILDSKAGKHTKFFQHFSSKSEIYKYYIILTYNA